jgi:hypothetical protein
MDVVFVVLDVVQCVVKVVYGLSHFEGIWAS